MARLRFENQRLRNAINKRTRDFSCCCGAEEPVCSNCTELQSCLGVVGGFVNKDAEIIVTGVEDAATDTDCVDGTCGSVFNGTHLIDGPFPFFTGGGLCQFSSQTELEFLDCSPAPLAGISFGVSLSTVGAALHLQLGAALLTATFSEPTPDVCESLCNLDSTGPMTLTSGTLTLVGGQWCDATNATVTLSFI